MPREVLSGKYRLEAVQLVRRDGWFYFVVADRRDVDVKPSKNVVEVDMGLRCQTVMAVLHEDGRIGNVEFVKYRVSLNKVWYYWN